MSRIECIFLMADCLRRLLFLVLPEFNLAFDDCHKRRSSFFWNLLQESEGVFYVVVHLLLLAQHEILYRHTQVSGYFKADVHRRNIAPFPVRKVLCCESEVFNQFRSCFALNFKKLVYVLNKFCSIHKKIIGKSRKELDGKLLYIYTYLWLYAIDGRFSIVK